MIIIKVTQAHIDSGVRRDCDHCPVANAIDNVLSLEWGSKVFETCFEIGKYDPKKDWLASHLDDLPKEAAQRANRYDDHGTMEPFEFELDIPPQYLKPNEEAKAQEAAV